MPDDPPVRRRVLVIDDDEVMLESCRRILASSGYDVDTEAAGLRGRDRAIEGSYDLVLVDMRLPDIDGLDLIAAVRESRSDVELIIVTGYSTVSTAVQAVKLGAFDYLPKPFTPDELRTRANAAIARLEQRSKQDANAARTARSRGIIGDSPQMAAIHALVGRVGPTDATVLIVGDSGTGKELLATEIHRASRRRERPMVSLDCSTLAPGLLESELFGHVKGSFTGAIASKPGLFETADHGTLFLDEVASLSLETQGKLLRTLESGEIKPVGGVTTKKVDIRLIAATNRDLGRMVAEQAFREDLFYRLNVVPIHLPPLRERPSDIPALLEHFLARYSHATGKTRRRLSAVALERLQHYPWPGNVRELKNVVERLVVTGEAETIREADLPEHIVQRAPERAPAVPRTNEELKAMKRITHERLCGELERSFVLEALRRNAWNVSRAARETGMLRPNFHALMRRHGIRAEE
ncbi:MAG TPA: sigma-54 dependent transcriptional regulator [Vicinamibacterales bacterium]|nr:sigma-54 dependent transcriptional regulator [Vicinamibacterales bacterium]